MNQELKALQNKISKALGEEKAQLVFKNGKIVNVFTGEILCADVAVEEGKIVGIGSYEGVEEVNLQGQYLLPGLIDAHMHIESSLSTPSQFARAVVPRGVTTVIADPHEIANVRGLAGIAFMIEDSKKVPLDAYFMLPSCVPATPFENSGAALLAKDLAQFMSHPQVLGLGEMMDYESLLQKNDTVFEKLLMAQGKTIDGHGPMLSQKELNAYIVAGVQTDHEASTCEEALEKVRLGMYILVREGSAARDLQQLLPAINKDNLRQFLFCTDDKHPQDLLQEGSIDFNVRLAIQKGLDPVDAIKIATINVAQCYGLKGKGAIAPGYDADLLVADNLTAFNIQKVYKAGRLVAENLQALFEPSGEAPDTVKDTVRIQKIRKKDLALPIQSSRAHVIGVRSGSLLTDDLVRDIPVQDGCFAYGPGDILKLAVIERHRATGNIGLGLIENLGIQGGAIGTTIAHDSHNIIVAGDNDEDMLLAIETLAGMGGGIALVSQGKILDSLPLPIGGLMTDRPLEETQEKLQQMMDIARQNLGVNPEIDPFMTLSFMALPVIPKLKLTDRGLFDVENYEFINLSEI